MPVSMEIHGFPQEPPCLLSLCGSALPYVSFFLSCKGQLKGTKTSSSDWCLNYPGKLPPCPLTMHQTLISSSFYKSKLVKTVPAILVRWKSTGSMSQTQ